LTVSIPETPVLDFDRSPLLLNWLNWTEPRLGEMRDRGLSAGSVLSFTLLPIPWGIAQLKRAAAEDCFGNSGPILEDAFS
jgi:hypothetical protein